MPKSISLTPAQQQTLSTIKRFVEKYKQAPTMMELKSELNLSSLRSVTQRLEGLERKGFIKRDRFQHRSIVVLDNANMYLSPEFVAVPVIASAGCDAMDVYAQDEFGEFIAVDKKLLGRATSIAAIKAVGDSMEDAGIKNGDYVIVEVTDQVSVGDRVVAIIGNMAVIKRYEREKGMVVLHPENKQAGYHPIVVSEEDSKVFGKVLSIIPGTDWVDDIKVEYYDGYGPR